MKSRNSRLGLSLTEILSHPAGKCLALVVVVILAFRLHDIEHKDWTLRFGAQTVAQAASVENQTSRETKSKATSTSTAAKVKVKAENISADSEDDAPASAAKGKDSSPPRKKIRATK